MASCECSLTCIVPESIKQRLIERLNGLTSQHQEVHFHEIGCAPSAGITIIFLIILSFNSFS